MDHIKLNTSNLNALELASTCYLGTYLWILVQEEIVLPHGGEELGLVGARVVGLT